MSKRKLLLADDSITIQKVVNLTFADEGIEVIAVGDGDSAMEHFDGSTPDLVLADVHMPGLNGYQICERIRQHPQAGDTPVILLVGSFEPFDESEASRVGANDYLTKPFQSIRQLVAKVTDLLEARAGAVTAPEPAVNGDEPHATAEFAEPDDIDNLYKDSFADTEQMPHTLAAATVLGDAGMDDEMIETTYAGGSEGQDAFDSEASAADSYHGESGDETENADNAGSDRYEQDAVDADRQPEAADIPEGRFFEHVESGDMPSEQFAEGRAETPPAFEASEDLHDTPQMSGFSDDGTVAAEQPETAPNFGSTAQFAGEIPETSSPAQGDFRLDEAGDLLELPGAEPRGLISNRLSEEDIDAIAQKAAEKISPELIRKVAWEVVPEIVDAVLRHRSGN